MRLVAIEGELSGTAELEGARHAVDLSLVDDPRIGDWLIVHAGFAIERLDEEEAQARLDLFSEMAQAFRDDAGDDEVRPT
jgi:hydrogenase expression/formation protein HypC